MLNGHAAPNQKQSFGLHSEDNTCMFLVIMQPTFKTKKGICQKSFKNNEAIHLNSLSNEEKNSNSIISFRRIINSQYGTVVLTFFR